MKKIITRKNEGIHEELEKFDDAYMKAQNIIVIGLGILCTIIIIMAGISYLIHYGYI